MSQQKISGDPQNGRSGFNPILRPKRFISTGSPALRIPRLFGMTFLLVSILFSLNLGCGAVGKPIPPEDVGIEAKKRKQERETGGKQDTPGIDEPLPPTEQPEELPPFYPVGGR